jgi:outer membrane lipoprotein SlyB
MINALLRVLLAGVLLMSSLACAAQRPVLHPNARLEAVGPAAAQQDIDECLQRAAAAGYESRPESKVAGSTAGGAGVGAAVGAAVGAVAGRPGPGAAMGAAGGATGGLIRGLFGSRDLDPVQRRSVEQCLQEKGYQVIGWQ